MSLTIRLWAIIFILLPFCVPAQQFSAIPPSIKWKSIQTNDATVIFPAGLDSQANRIANIMQLLNDSTVNTIGKKYRKWNIVLQNQTTISNAYVRLAPVLSELYMTPDPDNFSNGSLRWDDNLIIHENRHMQQYGNFNKGLTKVFSFLLGQEGQLFANAITIPNYFFEGDAVWQETLVSSQGRGRMPSFLNSYKALWLADKNYSWMKLRNGSFRNMIPNHYPTGYQLIAYGYEKYGADFWKKITGDAVRFKGLFYSFPRAVKRYSGKNYKTFRNEAMNYFKERSLLQETDFYDKINYISTTQKNNVINYSFPNYSSDDSIVISKRDYQHIAGFYIYSKGETKKIRTRDIVTDDYYSYKNGRIVYSAYNSDPRWGQRNYSDIRLLDIHTGKQKTITHRSKYFSPDISADGKMIVAVHVDPNGSNALHLLNATNGNLLKVVPNQPNFFFTQTKFISNGQVISAVRNPEGKMALLKVDLDKNETDTLSPFTYNVIGYPFIKEDTVYFNKMDNNADKIFAVDLNTKKAYRLTNNTNAVYAPSVNDKGEMIFSVFTAAGLRMASIPVAQLDWIETTNENPKELYNIAALQKNNPPVLNAVSNQQHTINNYKKGFHLFNFHSRRPDFSDPEYSYTFYSRNSLSSFNSDLYYTYNRVEKSHTVGFDGIYGGWFPLLSLGIKETFNRTINIPDSIFGVNSVQYNTSVLKTGFSIPLNFVGGRTSTSINIGADYNLEEHSFTGVGKKIFKNSELQYISTTLSLSNVAQQAYQHIFPRWAQVLTINYNDAVSYSNSHKLVCTAAIYMPGIFRNQNLVLRGAYQERDTLRDIFSNNFPYSRGYQSLSTRQMYEFGVEYHFPIAYPDWGFGNIIYFLRIRADGFYDHTNARARVNSLLTDIQSRTAGAELYFDTKIWNELSITFGIRYSHLLDIDLIDPKATDIIEFIVPLISF